MEIRKSLDVRKILGFLYVAFFAVYLIIGLTPAEAANYEISAKIEIPAINLASEVTTLSAEDHQLKTPDTIVGSFTRAKNKTFLIGHSTTVFKNLHELAVGDEIVYGGTRYHVTDVTVMEKALIDMGEILKAEDQDTLKLMTCAGEIFGNGDASHRLIVTAQV